MVLWHYAFAYLSGPGTLVFRAVDCCYTLLWKIYTKLIFCRRWYTEEQKSFLVYNKIYSSCLPTVRVGLVDSLPTLEYKAVETK